MRSLGRGNYTEGHTHGISQLETTPLKYLVLYTDADYPIATMLSLTIGHST